MYDRLLTAPGPDARCYIIRRDTPNQALATPLVFVTAGVNGKDADETAIANLADYSEHVTHDDPLILTRVEHGALGITERTTLIARAQYGLTETERQS